MKYNSSNPCKNVVNLQLEDIELKNQYQHNKFIKSLLLRYADAIRGKYVIVCNNRLILQ